MTDMMWPLRVAMMELDLIGGDEVFRKEALRCVRDIAQDMMDDLPDITLRQAQDAYNRFAARLRKRLGIKDTSTMKEMDQDGCIIDQEADTHEASGLVWHVGMPFGDGIVTEAVKYYPPVLQCVDEQADTPVVTEAKEPNPLS